MKIKFLFFALAAFSATPSFAIMRLSHHGDRMLFMNMREIVPTAKIEGYQKYLMQKDKRTPAYVDGDPLMAIPFAANVTALKPERLFPVFRILPENSQVLYLGFGLEAPGIDVTVKADGTNPNSEPIGYSVGSKPKDRLRRLQEFWRKHVPPGYQVHLTNPHDEWGRLRPYNEASPSKGDFLGVSLYRFNVDQLGLEVVNELILGLEQVLIQQGCTGQLSIFEPASSPVPPPRRSGSWRKSRP